MLPFQPIYHLAFIACRVRTDILLIGENYFLLHHFKIWQKIYSNEIRIAGCTFDFTLSVKGEALPLEWIPWYQVYLYMINWEKNAHFRKEKGLSKTRILENRDSGGGDTAFNKVRIKGRGLTMPGRRQGKEDGEERVKVVKEGGEQVKWRERELQLRSETNQLILLQISFFFSHQLQKKNWWGNGAVGQNGTTAFWRRASFSLWIPISVTLSTPTSIPPFITHSVHETF